MRRKRRKNKIDGRLVLAGVALLLLVVLAAVLLTQCIQNSDGQQSSASSAAGGSTPAASSSAAPSGGAPSLVAPSQPPVQSSLPQSQSTSSSISISEEKGPQPPPVFEQAPAVTVDGKKVSVTYKTNVSSTVNAILATSGEGVSVNTFYDYFNRGKTFDWAVAKKQTYMVGTEGKTETFELPDLKKDYYLLINAVENETDVWQATVLVVPVYQAQNSSSASGSSTSG